MVGLNGIKPNLVSPYKANHLLHIEGTNSIIFEFEKSVKVQYIMVKITEPHPYENWAIVSIRIKRNRIYGLIKADIGSLN